MRIFALLVIIVSFVSCSESSDKKSTTDLKSSNEKSLVVRDSSNDSPAITKSIGDSTYENEFFGLKIKTHEGWYAQDPKVTMKMTSQGAQMMVGDDQNMQAIVDASLKSTVPLFALYQFEPGAQVTSNPNVIGVAENIETLPGVKDGCGYLYHARKFLEQAAMKVEIVSECETRKVGKATLSYLDSVFDINGTKIYQRLNACIKDGYALTFTETYMTDEENKLVRDVVDSLEVECK